MKCTVVAFISAVVLSAASSLAAAQSTSPVEDTNRDGQIDVLDRTGHGIGAWHASGITGSVSGTTPMADPLWASERSRTGIKAAGSRRGGFAIGDTNGDGKIDVNPYQAGLGADRR